MPRSERRENDRPQAHKKRRSAPRESSSSEQESSQSSVVDNDTRAEYYQFLLKLYRQLYQCQVTDPKLIQQKLEQQLTANASLMSSAQSSSEQQIIQLQRQLVQLQNFKAPPLQQVKVRELKNGSQNPEMLQSRDLEIRDLEQTLNNIQKQNNQLQILNENVNMLKKMTGHFVAPVNNAQAANEYYNQIQLKDEEFKNNKFVFAIGNPANKKNYVGLIEKKNTEYMIKCLRAPQGQEVQDYKSQFDVNEEELRILIEQFAAQYVDQD
ncbi:Hypothetical_protein [Hexamita inflata]|uniref:Hypothetical_protein n=1 Tax=Hexamita inflata TaxID=28002 RepID=A0AA86Q7G8_9EUKA|nr:Hypothetical protein HINF_LOCUS21869 [Hexamita inflata]CAI9950628.1 Hypothetical protein HINF_LOCUS38273 [Hexamita inflata]CAI9951989.1 Hypothetical protein HINF_LOCUS39634 [Hexamita inflata]